jgi:hypothetical protein
MMGTPASRDTLCQIWFWSIGVRQYRRRGVIFRGPLARPCVDAMTHSPLYPSQDRKPTDKQLATRLLQSLRFGHNSLCVPGGGYGNPPYIVEHRHRLVGRLSMIPLKNGLDRSRGFHTASFVIRKLLSRYGKRGYKRGSGRFSAESSIAAVWQPTEL